MSDDDKPSLAEAIRLLAERDRRSLGNHPAIEELAAYHARELAPQAEARVREHLAVCHECTDLLLDLINFADLTPPPGEPDLTEDEMDEDWQALRARMGEAAKPVKGGEVVPIRPAPAAPDLGRTHSPWFQLAASLLAVLGIGFAFYQSFRVNELTRQLEAGRQPGVIELFEPPSGNERGGREPESGKQIRISSRSGGGIFLYPEEEIREYRIEILRGPDVRWETTATAQEEQAEILFNIPAGFLEPGSYTIRFSYKGKTDNVPFEVDG